MPDIIQLDDERISFNGNIYPCAIGAGGFVRENDKAEGDQKTPIGRFKITSAMYRPDKLDLQLNLTVSTTKITQQSGWCDEPRHKFYNQLVKLPFDASHEMLFRTDDAYDLFFITNHNSDPTMPHKGSAVFIHCEGNIQKGLEKTLGCLRLWKHDLIEIYHHLNENSYWDLTNMKGAR